MRRNHSRRTRQGARQAANREFRMAAKAERFAPFGIRRRLVFDSQQPILTTFQALIDDGVIDERVVPRMSLHVTEMPKVDLSKQMSRGIVAGYEFGRRSVKAREDIETEFSRQLGASLGEAAIFKHGNLGYRVHSEELEEEYHYVRLMMGRIGLKGTMRDVEPLHVTVAEIPRRDFRRQDAHAAVDILNELLGDADSGLADLAIAPIPEQITLDPIEFYPGVY